MPCRRASLCVVSIAFSLVVGGGCPGADILIPGLNSVQVKVIIDTRFLVGPNIRFNDDAGIWASLIPAERLSTDLIAPGEVAVFRFDCDELGLISSDGAEQVLLLVDDYVADEAKILEGDDAYDCGDLIRLRFVGDAEDFGVIVSVNGRIVD